jgi:putative endonuclease
VTGRKGPRSRDEPLGARGERLAAAHLQDLGYRLEARNLRTRLGEIDLLVRRRRIWVAVEVKTRTDHAAPERCVADEQLARIGRALRALAPGLRPRPRALRVDLVAVRLGGAGTPEIRHFPGREDRWSPG